MGTFRCLALLALALLGAAVGGDLLASESALRTFVVYIGQPELAVEVNGETIGETDSDGNLKFSVEIAAGEPMRFRALSADRQLDAVRTVPVEDPAIPILWDLSSQLRPAEADAEAEAAVTAVDRLAQECRGRRSLKCMQASWAQFTARVARRDCPGALEAARELMDAYPALLRGQESVTGLATAYLDCGLRAEGQLRRSRIRRAIDLLEGYREGESWCGAQASRALARGYETLGEIRAAAESAARAEARCGEASTAALEWEFYFRIKLGELERCRQLAEGAPRRLGLFLRAWIDSLSQSEQGGCRAEIELNPSGDLPCAGLPQEFCSRQYGRILLRCGTTREDFVTAARYLRGTLALDPRGWEDLAGESRGFVAMLAEAEYLSENFSEAARLYEELLTRYSAAELEHPGEAEIHATLLRRHADSLMLANPGSPELERALQAYRSVRKYLASDAVALAIIMNNICVLQSRLASASAAGSAASSQELGELAAALESVPEEDQRLRLLLRISSLTLQLQAVERDPSLSTRERLAKLRQLRAPFEEYQEEIKRDIGTSSTEIIKHQGRLFALALP